MFNPKVNNLLDDQLSVSGLEMNAWGAVISAGASIVGGIFGASEADKQNDANEKAQKEAEKAAEEAAEATNEYNQEVFEADVANYYNNRNFEYETALIDYQYQQAIRDYEYRAVLDQYAKSVEDAEAQLTFNSIAAADAYQAEQAALNDIFAEDAFNQQQAIIDKLIVEGQAGLGQAGNSRNKAVQSALAGAGLQKQAGIASIEGAIEQSQRNMQAIAMDKLGADLAAEASIMIMPEMLPEMPIPELGPEMIFVEPMEVTPTYIPPATTQSVYTPLISGVSSAASSLSGVDWSGLFGGGGGSSYTLSGASTPTIGTSTNYFN